MKRTFCGVEGPCARLHNCERFQAFQKVIRLRLENASHRLLRSTAVQRSFDCVSSFAERMNFTLPSRVLALHLRQQLLNPVFLLDCNKPVLDVVVAELRLRLTDCFIVSDFALHAVKGSAL
ncbi:MAG: hypothetical protein JWN74_2981 [Acidobacteriaceae bacterium]|nr:hypothetical protein [Acidobacteriaceae bacterium]